MATNAPSTRCWICGEPDTYRAALRERPPNAPFVFGPTEWEWVPHEHTEEQVSAWVERMFGNRVEGG